jgi:hypothetical protein
MSINIKMANGGREAIRDYLSPEYIGRAVSVPS